MAFRTDSNSGLLDGKEEVELVSAPGDSVQRTLTSLKIINRDVIQHDPIVRAWDSTKPGAIDEYLEVAGRGVTLKTNERLKEEGRIRSWSGNRSIVAQLDEDQSTGVVEFEAIWMDEDIPQ